MGTADATESFLALASAVEELVYVWRPSGEMLWVNRAFERETGMTLEEFGFRNADNPFIHPEDLPAVLAAMEAFLSSDDLVSAPIANRFFDAWGKTRSVVSRVHKITGQEAPALLLVSMLVSEVVTAGAPTDSRTLVEMADDGILRLAGSGRINYSNRSLATLTGLSHVELHKHTLDTLFLADDREAVRAAVARALASSSASVTARLESGPHLDIKLSRLQTSDPATVLLAIARDVTAQQRAKLTERALEENERRLRFLTDNVPTVMLYQVVIDQHGQRRFTYVSAGAQRLHDVKPEAVLADPNLLYGQIHEQDLPRVTEAERASMRDCSSFEVEVRMRRGSEVRWALLRSLPRRLPDGSTIWEGVEIDITSAKRQEQERQRLEESLRQAQKMESVGRLAGGVAHDFNNMLTAIKGNIEVARLDLGPNDRVLEALDQARRAAESAENLTRQLLTFSRTQVIVPKVLDLNDVVRRVYKMLVRMLGEDVTIELTLQSNLGNVRFDPGQLEQALVNLAVNARDAMPDGGRLTLSTRDETLSPGHAARLQLEPGRFVVLGVKDTGTGMSADIKARLFEPFFTTKGTGKGTGLGLSMVYGAIHQGGGAVQVESEPGQGSVFELYLPRIEEPLDIPTNQKQGLLSRGSETIWVVEDEHVVRTLVQTILARQGYEVRSFPNAAEALAAAETDAPCQLLLSDLVMPNMNGRELAERLVARRPNLRVLFMSGYTEDMVVLRGIAEHGIELIAKPFTVQELARRVRLVLDMKADLR